MRHFAPGDMPQDAWFGQQAVYRISLGNFVSLLSLQLPPPTSTLCKAPTLDRAHRVAYTTCDSTIQDAKFVRISMLPVPSCNCICTVPPSPLPPDRLTATLPCPSTPPLPRQVLFGSLAVVMVDVRYKSDRRDAALHHGHWLLKAGLWLACNILPFFLPVGVVGAYSWLARFGSPLFLLIQMVILLVGAAPPCPSGLPLAAVGGGLAWCACLQAHAGAACREPP